MSKVAPVPETVRNIEEVQLPWGWWLDPSFRGGVSRRIGWWKEDVNCRWHQYVVVFRDGTRGPVTTGTNPLEEKEQ